ncbi:MAG: right-handed parallel beta-helix repeat-containing protein, partial [Candidatus Aenigmarchaeota archaeon]|nr:right-handed parallel beta-helix repeat-containing protein [Candidatus Aenigmarchaeota archaeon]
MKKLLFALFLFVIMSTSGFAWDCYNITSAGAISNVGNYSYIGGAWNITTGTNLSCTNVTLNLTGNLTVYGNLTLSDVDMLVNLTNTTPYDDVTNVYGYGTGYNLNTTSTYIHVYSGGKLNITNYTNITANESWDNNNFWCGYEFVSFTGSTLEIRDSFFKHVGCNNRSDYDSGWQAQWTRFHGIRIETNNSKIVNNTIYVNGSWAINFWNSSHNLAENNTVQGVGITVFGGGILISNAGEITASIVNGYNNTVFNNTVYDVHHGTYGWNAVNNTYANNTIIRILTQNNQYGTLLYNYSTNNIVENNTYLYLDGTDSAGVWLQSYAKNNIIRKNSMYDNKYGAYIFGSSDNNTFAENTINNTYTGLEIRSSNNTVYNNTMVDSSYRLGHMYTAYNNQIFNNTFRDAGPGVNFL